MVGKPHGNTYGNMILKAYFVAYFSAVPCSDDDFCLPLFMITPNDFVCCTSSVRTLHLHFSGVINSPCDISAHAQ